MRRRAHVRVGALGLVAALGLAGCASAPLPGALRREPTLRLSEVADVGDATRRASQRLVLDGLEHDAASDPAPALARYERALRIDPQNPYAWLAIARHYVATDRPEPALRALEQAEILFEADGPIPPRVAPHVVGLRGAALRRRGRTAEGARLLLQAGDLAPRVWGDGALDARELR